MTMTFAQLPRDRAQIMVGISVLALRLVAAALVILPAANRWFRKNNG